MKSSQSRSTFSHFAVTTMIGCMLGLLDHTLVHAKSCSLYIASYASGVWRDLLSPFLRLRRTIDTPPVGVMEFNIKSTSTRLDGNAQSRSSVRQRARDAPSRLDSSSRPTIDHGGWGVRVASMIDNKKRSTRTIQPTNNNKHAAVSS
jgi:hypothetical protein